MDPHSELRIILEQIKHLQRHINLCRRMIRTATHPETKDRARADMDRARNEVLDLEVIRDRLREEIEGSDFWQGEKG